MQKYFRAVVCIAFILSWTNIVRGQAATPSEPVPVINVSEAIGTNIACGGNPSMSPNVQHFTIEGYNLTEDVVLRPSPNIEISTDPSSGYTRSITLSLTAGSLPHADIYVRSAAAALTGSWTGKVVVTTGAITKKVSVDGVVYGYGSLDQIGDKTWAAGSTNAIHFTGSATDFTWTNDNPAIGLHSKGTGDIASFTAVNKETTPLVATITATPANPSACSAGPMTFTITVSPPEPSTILTAGKLSQLSTVYGTPSTAGTFSVYGDNMPTGITVNPPAGFEVSIDGITYQNTLVVGAAGNISSTKVYVRLAKTTPVGSFMGDIKLTSGTATNTIATDADNTVVPMALTITADNKSKIIDNPNPAFTLTYKGFVNGENSSTLTTQPTVSTTATLASPIANYPITAAGAASPNYTFTYVEGTLQVVAEPVNIVVNNTFTPNGDGINDTWTIKNIEGFPNNVVQIFDRYGNIVFYSVHYSVAWNGKFKGADVPIGTYYYIIDLKNGSKITSGCLTVLR